jgi:hypothetical protein
MNIFICGTIEIILLYNYLQILNQLRGDSEKFLERRKEIFLLEVRAKFACHNLC